MNVTPIHRILRPASFGEPLYDPENVAEEASLSDVKRLLDRYTEELKNSLAPIQATYFLDNVVRPRPQERCGTSLNVLEKMLYFLAGMVATLVVFAAVRQVEQRHRRN